jgi:hypothetical protein
MLVRTRCIELGENTNPVAPVGRRMLNGNNAIEPANNKK